jgi:hypothetical protein
MRIGKDADAAAKYLGIERDGVAYILGNAERENAEAAIHIHLRRDDAAVVDDFDDDGAAIPQAPCHSK